LGATELEYYSLSPERFHLRIAVIGCGHVGLVTGICLASLGHHVTCVDRSEERIRLLVEGRLPLYEPHLDELLLRGRSVHALTFTSDSANGTKDADVIFLCVGVPQLENGDSDFSALDFAVRQIAQAVDAPKLIVMRSTVPVQTGEKLLHLLDVYRRNRDVSFCVASNPQFLREGTSVEDFLHADRILLGVEDAASENTLREIYAPVLEQNFPCPVHLQGCPPRKSPELLLTKIHSAELIKYTSNAFLAVKISYANVLADLCERLGADVQEVTRAVGLDPRISPGFLEAGLGFGGSRLPQDLRAFCRLTGRTGVEAGILQAAEEVNRSRIGIFFKKLQRSLWVLKDKRIGLLGLAHKPNTDDVRGSPAIELLKLLSAAGAQVRAYDPRAMDKARSAHPSLLCGSDAYDVAGHADALIVAADWDEFLGLDWPRIRDIMARPAVFDGRNLLSPSRMKALGFEYHSVGRPDSCSARIN
jgi:UDPglucose 6-dehydrogenase